MEDDPRNLFKKLEDLNNPTTQYVCRRCGTLIISRKQHYKWHRHIEKEIEKTKSSIPYWPGVD